MHRFFIDANMIIDNNAVLSRDDAEHAARVLRLRNGESIVACDGMGFEYDAVIISADKSKVELALSNKREVESESRYKITLVQCLPKSGKMEFIIQKCVELGVCEFIPVNSIRSVIRVDASHEKAKLERYNKIAYEAAKQSQRGIVPIVRAIRDLGDIADNEYDLLIVAYEEEHMLTVKQLLGTLNKMENVTRIGVVIGSEGGLDPAEVERLKQMGGIPVTLGKRILRTETAGMATVAALMCMLEG